jgi:hypothetical protein
MRKSSGKHLKIYRVILVEGPVVTRTALERCNEEADIEDFDLDLVEEYLAR